MNFSDISDVISKIEGVTHVKLAVESDDLKEVHILAGNSRAPKQIVRDIESALFAAFDYRIDRKIISIAQIDMEGQVGIQRIKYEGVVVEISGNNIYCTVKLNYEDEIYSATNTAVRTSANSRKVVARAAISAVEGILGQTEMFDVQEVLTSTSGDVTFISVIVSMVMNDVEETMVGSAIVRNDINETIVKATLDSLNRRVQRNIS